MYSKYFGFSEDPFQLTPDPQFLFLDDIYREAMAHLQYGIQTGRGFVMLTGEVGTGKTTLVHSYLDEHRDDVHTGYIFSTTMSFVELLKLIHEDFGTGVQGDSEAFLLIELNRFLLSRYREGKKTALILDEAQNLTVELLEKIRMLSNLEARKSKLVQIVLVGQPELAAKLERSDLRQLRQRVAVRFDIPAMSADRTREYIEHRIAVAGGSGSGPFAEDVSDTIHDAADGIPRMVNVICSNALLLAFASDRHTIDKSIIDEVIADLRRGVANHGEESAEPVVEQIAAAVSPELASPAIDPDRPLTTEEAGAYLRVSTKTTRSLFQKGAIRATKVGRGWRVFKEDLDRFVRFGPENGKAEEGNPEERAAIDEGSLREKPGTDSRRCDSEALAGAIEKRWASARLAYGAQEKEGDDESSRYRRGGVYRKPHGEGTAEGGVSPGHRR